MTRQNKVTSHEVAALAGVSRSAVSRTFTPGASVSVKTREKVQKAADQLGYRPNVLARSLIVRSTHMIGLVMSEWQNPFYTQMLRQFSERFQAEGYQLLLLTSTSDAGVDDSVRQLLQYQVDGLLIVSAKPSEAMAQTCAQAGTPIVLVNRQSPVIRASSVTCDNAQIGRDIFSMLKSSGYQQIALVLGDPKVQTSVERNAAMNKAVAADKDIKIIAEIHGCLSYQAGREAIADLWNGPKRPDAIVCSSDQTALGVLDGARLDLKLAVPEDIAVVGLGDIPQSSWGAYRLTTVNLPLDEMINLAVEDLLAHVDDPELSPRRMKAKARLVFRDSVRPLRDS